MLLELSPNSRKEDNFELQVRAPQWTGAASRGKEGAGSLPFPVHMADVGWRIMGGITSSPAVLVHRASQTNMKNNDIIGQASFLQLGRPAQLQEI